VRRLSLAISCFLFPAAAGAVMPARAPALYVEGEVLVTYRAGVDAGSVQATRTLGLVSRRRFQGGRTELLELPRYLTVPGAIETLRADPAVAYAGPNFRRFRRAAVPPGDPLFPRQWGLANTGQGNFFCSGPAGASGGDLNLLSAWDADGDGVADRTGDPAVIVAVIDDAFDVDHEDLAANMVAGRDFKPNGQNDADPRPSNDEEVHGTYVAGCIAAVGDNGLGVAGVAWNAKVMPLKFDFDIASHIAALEFARDNGARIINASFGGPGYSQPEEDAIDALADSDILYVAAAGNDDSNTDVAQLSYPANYDARNIVAVAATNRQDNIASFSQYGPTTVDVAAPGLQIVTTAVGSTYESGPPGSCLADGESGSAGVTGTSFAAPYTAGVAALLRSHVTPVPGYREMKARLIESGTVVSGASAKERTAGGRIDADRALDMSPGPALVIEAVNLTGGDGNGQLDPGESLTAEVTLRNLWLDAANVSATLSASQHVTVDAAAATLGPIAANATATANFPATVAAGAGQHRYVPFTLTVTADGYSATRGFILEVGRLTLGAQIAQSFVPPDTDLYDEFHAWHVELPALPEGHNQLVIETTSQAQAAATPDIDLLVKHGVPPQYNITVGINPEDEGFFCTSGTTVNCQDPATHVSAGPDGTEQVVIDNPQTGTYHLVVVNFAQLEGGLQYTLHAYTRAGPRRSGGGGGLPPALLALFLGMALLRRNLR